ncbi:MAG: hypothetical protein JWP88_445 [Flaviaesturariibacter sp.]|nr:hypothetical protein [Flaviaesturariibacter sp.]
MENDLDKLDIEALKRMHQTASFKMQAALLNGAEWNEVRDHREMVTGLAIAIHKKQPSYFLNPAESPNRRDDSSGAPTGNH